MTKDVFNGTSATGYAHHVAVFKDMTKVSSSLLAMPEPDLAELMADESKVESFAQKQQQLMQGFGRALDQVSANLKQSTALSDDVRGAFLAQVAATKAQIGVQGKMMAITVAALKGFEPSYEQQIQLQSEQQAAQIGVARAQKALVETIYGFTPGQTLSDVNTSLDMTIVDFERYNAMMIYTMDLAEFFKDLMPALQDGDMNAVGHVVDLIDDIVGKLQDVSFSVMTSSAMTDTQKNLCGDVLSASKGLLTALNDGLKGAMEGDMDALMGMMQSIAGVAKKIISAQGNYYSELDAVYTAAASAPSAKADKGGPKLG